MDTLLSTPKPSNLDNQPVWTIYRARIDADSPVAKLLEPVRFSLTYQEATRITFDLTVNAELSGYGQFFYTYRLNKMEGPVRRWQQMPWGELVPDFS